MGAAAGGTRLNNTAAIAHAIPKRLLRPAELGLALACFIGSAATIQKYGGIASTVAYLIVLLGGVPLVIRASAKYLPRVRPSMILLLAVATLAVLALLFAVIYPHANTHAHGLGSDRDDAADLAARAVLHGHWPYYRKTYLGNPISQLPGLVLLAVPFVALGHSAYAAFFWLPVLFVLLRYRRGEWRTPLLLLWLALLASPVLVREIVTGGDLVANTVSVMLAMCLVELALERGHGVGLAAASLFLGFVLSSRVTFLFVLPPLVALAWRWRGASRAIAVPALAACGFAAVTLPFYLGRSSFPPFKASDHLTGFDGSVPGGQWLIIAVAIVLSLVLAMRAPVGLGSVFGQAAAVQAFFLIAVVVHDSGHAGTLDTTELVPGYGLPVLLLALAAAPSAAAPLRRAVRLEREMGTAPSLADW